jgi:hypothetical protein
VTVQGSETGASETGTSGTTRVAALHLFGVSRRHVPNAFGHMAADRFWLRRAPGLRFVKMLGTGKGDTFLPSDADLLQWAMFTVWDSPAEANVFANQHKVMKRWDSVAAEKAEIRLRPLRWKGEWSRQKPFSSVRGSSSDSHTYDGPVASLTRARIKTTHLRSFLQAVPPVAAEVGAADGLLFRVGIGEAPIGLQATFSIWNSPSAVDQFAYRHVEHQQVVRRTASQGWYAEELFTRFAVQSATGTVKGASMEVVQRLISGSNVRSTSFGEGA